ncbi:TPA: hypothetical protein HA338_02985 [Methanosarcina acetivorans]|uniref:Uncharacterized protein n=2 Tax=Methanosarcina acetivorans TaxID=2214 RepID=Q8TQ59_METAC|nr:hypothetical protein [Methanosarcina acetivorans]AAM05100.1 predicted protein [Methanosarcina acetivorans C2A]HIH93031.1 hypothetical protein [Methanosarcina acetivorans]
MKSVHVLRKFSGKKYGTKKTHLGTKKAYPPEECLNPEFIKEVECSRQKVLNGKGIKFNTVDDFFSNLEK